MIWAALLAVDADLGDRVTEFWRGLLLVFPFFLIGSLTQVMLLQRLAERARLKRIADEATKIRYGERRGLAQELHDAVANELTLMSVQAANYHRNNEQDPDELIRSLDASARSSLVELRALMNLLIDEGKRTSDEHDGPWHTKSEQDGRTPAAQRLQRIVDHLRDSLSAAGFHPWTEVTVEPDAGITQSHLSACVRVLQESSTNIAKHAEPGSQCSLTVHSDCTELTVAVVSLVQIDRVSDLQLAITGIGGQGLTGMRERVDLAGGTLTADSYADQWCVRAVFPLQEN